MSSGQNVGPPVNQSDPPFLSSRGRASRLLLRGCGVRVGDALSTFLVHLLILIVVLPVVVCEKPFITIAVAAADEANETSIRGSSHYLLGNGTMHNITVLWTIINTRHPFQIRRHITELIHRQTDLIILPDDVLTTVEAATAFNSTSSPLASYVYEQQGKADDNPYGSCASNLDLQSFSFLEQGVTCNRSGVTISTVDALVAVIQTLDWEELIVLYSQNQELTAKKLSERLESMANTPTLLLYNLIDWLHNVTSGEGRSLHGLIDELYDRRRGELRVVLLCEAYCVGDVLSAASQFDALDDKGTAMALISRWLLVLEPHEQQMLESCDLQLDNVAVVVRSISTELPFVDNIETETENILRTSYDAMLENNITVSGTALVESIKQNLQSAQACYSAYVRTLLWKPEGRRLSNVGHVTQDKQLHLEQGQEVFPNIKFGLNNRKFRVATLPWPSFVERTGNGSYEGLCVDLLHQLRITLNFSYEWTEPEDQQWGAVTDNGSWTGLVGLLHRKEVDLMVAPLAIQAGREAVMDFAHPFYIDYTTVLLKLPDPDESKWKRLVQPFQSQVHMSIWLSLLGVTVLTFLMEFVNPFYKVNTNTMLHLGEIFWYMFGALLTQGGARVPDSQAGRTMVSAFWLFSIIMAATYSGNLIAFLTVSKDKAPFQTLAEMVEQDRYTWGTIGGTFYVSLFRQGLEDNQNSEQARNERERLQHLRDSSIQVYQKIWKGLARKVDSDPDILSGDPEVHLEKVKRGYYAYIGDKSAISTWLKTECDLITVEEFQPMQYAIGLVNNSAYTRMFSDVMLEINEIGLTQTWVRKWWGKTGFCKPTLTASATRIELSDVQSAFYLVCIGITVSLLTLAMERLVDRFHVVAKIKGVFSKKREGTHRSSGASVTVRTPVGVQFGHELRHQAVFYTHSPGRKENHGSGRVENGGRVRRRAETVFHQSEVEDGGADIGINHTHLSDASTGVDRCLRT